MKNPTTSRPIAFAGLKGLTRLSGLAGLAGLAFTASAQTQTSPTPQAAPMQVYGQISAGISYKTHQAASKTELSNNLLNGSHIGFRGTEDMGGGLLAIVQLESGLATDTGTAGSGSRFWNRQSTVGLSMSGQFVATLGRQFHASTDRVTRSLDAFGVNGSSLHVTPLALFGVNKFAGNDSRSDDTVKLRWNGPSGLTVGVSSAFEDSSSGRSASFDVAQITREYVAALYGVRFKSPTVIAATGDRPEHRVIGGGGQYRIGDAVLYMNIAKATTDASAVGRPRQSNTLVVPGVAFTLAPWVLKASYTHDKGGNLNNVAGRDGAKKTLIAAAEYFFSRRTAASFSVFSNSFTAGYKLEPTNIAGLGRQPGSSSTSGCSIGIRHNF